MRPDCRGCAHMGRTGWWVFGTSWCMRPVPDLYDWDGSGFPRTNECRLERTDRVPDNCGPSGRFFRPRRGEK